MNFAGVRVTVTDLDKAIAFYTALLQQEPQLVTTGRWAEWYAERDRSNDDMLTLQRDAYFGILTQVAAEQEVVLRGNNAVVELRVDNIVEEFNRTVDLLRLMGGKVIYPPTPAPTGARGFTGFEITDPDGNRIEIYAENPRIVAKPGLIVEPTVELYDVAPYQDLL